MRRNGCRGNGGRASVAKAGAQDGRRGKFVSDGDGGLGSDGGFASEGKRDFQAHLARVELDGGLSV